MPVSPELRPTLWRTCRVLANSTRLKIFGFLAKEPDQTVSIVAERCHLSRPLASEYLRYLESRCLLEARRRGRLVRYRIASADRAGQMNGLVRVLELIFAGNAEPVHTVFQLATAFTHPRRIEIFRALLIEPSTVNQLRRVTGISAPALRRHLAKLEKRGFTSRRQRVYSVKQPLDSLRCELARLSKR